MVAPVDDFANAAEIIQDRLYFACVQRPECIHSSPTAAGQVIFEIDSELVFEPFFADFGPLSLGKTYRFCQKVNRLLNEAAARKQKCYYYCGPHVHSRANAAVLIGCYQVLYLDRTAEEAYKLLVQYKPFVPFRDASCGPSTFHLTVLDCMKGIQKARDVGFIDWNSGNSSWSLEEYEHYEQVENGDLNWILPGKLLAFSGPAARGNEIPGYRLFTPEDYWDYYKRRNVTAVVRLNKKLYDRKRFTDGGIRHYDLYFPDGTCPTEPIILKFLEIAEREPGALAVHCKAGLGRTGVLILCFLMKHYRFTTEEAIGYIRIARPGSVIGPQQNFMREVEKWMWEEGDLYRQKMGLPKDHLGFLGASTDLSVSGHAPTGPHGAMAVQQQYGRDSSGPSACVPSSDMSLMQYRSAAGSGVSAVSLVHSMNGGAGGGSAGGAASSSGGVATRGSAWSSSPSGGGSSGGGTYSTRMSTTPMRLQTSDLQPPHLSTSPPTTPTHASLAASRAAKGTSLAYSAMSQSTPSMAARAGASSSTDWGASSAGLRATLHTDTVYNADRQKMGVPQRTAQSAVSTPGSGWKIGSAAHHHTSYYTSSGAAGQRVMGSVHSRAGSRGGAGTAYMSPKSSAPVSNSGGVTRTLAPNGQPRKVPISMLAQYQSRMHHGGQGAVGMGVVVGMPVSASVDSGAGRMNVKSPAQLRFGLRSK